MDVYNNPDDPYKVRLEWEPGGDLQIIVSAETLGDSKEVRDECTRRAEFLKNSLLDLFGR